MSVSVELYITSQLKHRQVLCSFYGKQKKKKTNKNQQTFFPFTSGRVKIDRR